MTTASVAAPRSASRDALARRSVATGTRGAVAAGSAAAAAIGAGVLTTGGNAYDAALAAALAEIVLLPPKCGLAGDVVALHVRAGETAPTALVSIGPSGVGVGDVAAARGWPTPLTGGLSVGVPGAPAGYARLASYGRMPLPALVEPAVRIARRGIVWSPTHARLAGEADAVLRRHQPEGSVYRPAARPRAVGETVVLSGLARVLEDFSERGEALFTGELGAAVVEYVGRHGGVLTADDLLAARAVESTAAATRLADGRTLFATGAPTYGPALLGVVAERVAAGSATTDPEQARVAVARVRDEPLTEGTSTVAACDDEGNAVVVVHSNSFPQFGSGLVVPGTDLVLSNRAGRGFTWQPDHPNAPEPGRRPSTTLHAWAFRDGGDWVLGATPGGEQQVGWNAQLLDHLLVDASPAGLGAALVAPRWDLGTGVDRAVRHEGTELPELGVRSSHTVVRTGALCNAAADPRLDGGAVAW
ncbi:gamma-glutamyltransferase [Jatrophihabitans sp. YIM 134969]